MRHFSECRKAGNFDLVICSAGLRQAIIEKDYYVAGAPRIISLSGGDKVIFKGGTTAELAPNIPMPSAGMRRGAE